MSYTFPSHQIRNRPRWNSDSGAVENSGCPGGAHSAPEARTSGHSCPQQGCNGVKVNAGGVGHRGPVVLPTLLRLWHGDEAVQLAHERAVVERARRDRLVEDDGCNAVDPRRGRRGSGFRLDDTVEGVEPDPGYLGRGVVRGLFVSVRSDARRSEHQTNRQGQCRRSFAYHLSLLV